MKYFWLLTICLLFSACSNKDDITLEIGEGFSQIDTRVILIDTMSVVTSTFKFDSLSVSNSNRLLIGSYDDSVFGKTKTEGYLQFNSAYNNIEGYYSYNIDNEAVYDSIALILKYDNYYYNDTIPNQNYKVYKLTEDIEPDEDTFEYFNTTNYNYENSPLADKNTIINPIKEDSIFVKLNNTYGLSLFEKIKDNDFENEEDFLEQYKGLIVKSDEDNTSIIGLKKDCILRLFYSIPSETEPIEKEIDFVLNTNNSFSNISNTYENTYFEGLENQETQLNSSSSGNQSYMQSGVGLTTRISIPNLNRLYDISREGIIVNAYLTIPVKKINNTQNLHIRDSLRALLINEKSENLGYLEESTAFISDESTEFDNAYFIMNMKPFLDLKLREDEFNENLFLALIPQDFSSSINRYIFYNSNDENKQAKLEILYAIYDEE